MQTLDPSTPDEPDPTRSERYRLVTEIEAMLDGPTSYLAILLLGYVAGVLAALLFGKRPEGR